MGKIFKNYTNTVAFKLLPLIARKRWISTKIVREMVLQNVPGVVNNMETIKKMEKLNIADLRSWYDALFFGKYNRILGSDTFPSNENVKNLKVFNKEFKKHNK